MTTVWTTRERPVGESTTPEKSGIVIAVDQFIKLMGAIQESKAHLET